MANTTPTPNHGNCNSQASVGITVPFSDINQPGCYVCNRTGQLIRVPDDVVTPGRAPVLDIVGTKPLLLTKISDNPFVPLTEARFLACNSDLHVTF